MTNPPGAWDPNRPGQPSQQGQPGGPQYGPPQGPYGPPPGGQPGYPQGQPVYPPQQGYGPPTAGPQQGGYPPPGYPPQGPGYGPPPGYAVPGYGPPPRKNNTPWILGGGAVAIVVAVVLVLVFTVFTGGSKKNDTSSPKGAVTSFINALKDKDWTAAEKVSTGEAKQLVETAKTSSSKGDDPSISNVSWSIGNVNETGDHATVDVKAKYNGNSETTTFVVDKQNGKWLVSNINDSSASGGGGLGSGNSSTTRSPESPAPSPGGQQGPGVGGKVTTVPRGLPTNSKGQFCWPKGVTRPNSIPAAVPNC